MGLASIHKPCMYDYFHDEEGFSTVGLVLALLITLSLIFTAAQVYQINSQSASIQNIADAAALAAENEVAEFYVIVRLCDALVLSFSLVGLLTLGIGLVALCIPPTAVLGETLISSSRKIIHARDTFSSQSTQVLNTLQKALPFLCALNAQSVIEQNSGGALNMNYRGFSVCLPLEAQEIAVESLEADDLIDEVDLATQDIKDAAKRAEEAAHIANEEKKKAYLYDCGNNPGYCMYERAAHLASLTDEDNPLYHTIDTWSFSVALKRAQAYYPQRLAKESPDSLSAEDQARSVLRKHFYEYAVTEIDKGYVNEEEAGTFDAYFPLLPKNTSEMKETTLYEQRVYPIASGAEVTVMHAWTGCPGIGESVISEYGSLEDLDARTYQQCDHCKLSASSLGKVAAASTSIDNGFEYHYVKVAEAVQAYQKAWEDYEPSAQVVKDLSSSFFDRIFELIDQAGNTRIEVEPPGRYGSISFVVKTDVSSVSQNFESLFVKTTQSLGTQYALSAAALVEEPSKDGATIISSLLDNVSNRMSNQAIGGLDIVVDLWSSLMYAYSNGYESIEEGIKKALDSIPLISESGLGTWAAQLFSDLMTDVGLEPVKLGAPKPVVVNTAHVLSKDGSSLSREVLKIKQSALAQEGSYSNSFSYIFSALDKQAFENSIDDRDVLVASLEFLGEDGQRIPIIVELPQLDTTPHILSIMELFGSGLTEDEGRRWL